MAVQETIRLGAVEDFGPRPQDVQGGGRESAGAGSVENRRGDNTTEPGFELDPIDDDGGEIGII